MASERAKRGGGKETSVAESVTAPSSAYQVTVSFNPAQGGVQLGNGADWFGPLNPMTPTAPPEVSGRRYDFPAGYNLVQTPRAYEDIGFQTLRMLADNYDLIRIIIETRKDQLTTLNWNIVPRDPKQRVEGDIEKRIKEVEAFFLRPDKEHFWDEWLRMVMEDLLVIDAPTLYRRRTNGGELYALQPVDGATIKCVIDDWGRVPEPPTPAFQQVLKGLPAVNYTTEELIYKPRNRRTNKVYGYSPVEQIIMTVNIALRRQVFQLQYFTEGNIPEALIGVPETWTPDQIKQFQDWFDGILQGNTGERRRARFVPNAVGKTYIPTKDNELFGKAEEWLARVVCFAFSVNPQPFVAMMNRATADSAREEADRTGMVPLMKYVKGLVDTVILDDFGYDDLQFKWDEEEGLDAEKKQKMLSGYVADGLMSINEARIQMGKDPSPHPMFNKLMMKTSMGYIPIENGPIQTNAATNQGVSSQGSTGPSLLDDKPAADESAPPVEDEAAADPDKTKKLMKAATSEDFADIGRPTAKRAIRQLKKILAPKLAEIGKDVADQIRRDWEEPKAEKADTPNDDTVAGILSRISLGLSSMFEDLEDGLSAMFDDSAVTVLGQLEVSAGKSMMRAINAEALTWASARGVELVGKNATKTGLLDETTRNMLRETILAALNEGGSAEEVAKAVETSHAFSEDRAETIAFTEIARANSHGALEGYRKAAEAGVDVKKSWFNREDACEVCAANGEEGAIDLDTPFQSGDLAPPGHPECACAIVPVIGDSSNE